MKFDTRNTTYTLTEVEGSYTIQGHPRYCPTPTPVMLPFGKPREGRSFFFVYVTPPPGIKPVVHTSRVQRIWE